VAALGSQSQRWNFQVLPGENMVKTGGSNIFLAAAIRSGSTHIATSLCKLLGMRMGRTSGFHGEGEEEQIVNPYTAAILMPYGGFVFQQHTKATSVNMQLLKSFDNKIIVLTRNILDSLVSLREWINSEESGVIPGLKIPEDFVEWQEHAQWVWLTYHALPWYTSFVFSWLKQDVYWIDYDAYYADQVKGVKGIFSRFGIPPPEDNAIAAVVNNRFHIRTGKSGRGKELFPEALHDTVLEHFLSWGRWANPIREKLL